MQKSVKHKELGDFLKTRRLRLSPGEVGLHSESARRRIDGLRREEVAALSGVSLAWYTYLEQGRSIRVSDQVLESLARTLKLDKDERTYLFQLAGHGCPTTVPPPQRMRIEFRRPCSSSSMKCAIIPLISPANGSMSSHGTSWPPKCSDIRMKWTRLNGI